MRNCILVLSFAITASACDEQEKACLTKATAAHAGWHGIMEAAVSELQTVQAECLSYQGPKEYTEESRAEAARWEEQCVRKSPLQRTELLGPIDSAWEAARSIDELLPVLNAAVATSEAHADWLTSDAKSGLASALAECSAVVADKQGQR